VLLILLAACAAKTCRSGKTCTGALNSGVFAALSPGLTIEKLDLLKTADTANNAAGLPTVEALPRGGVAFQWYVTALKVIVRIDKMAGNGAPVFMEIDSAANADADAPTPAFARCRHPILDQYAQFFGSENVTAKDLLIVPRMVNFGAASATSSSSLNVTIDPASLPLCAAPAGKSAKQDTPNLLFADESSCNDAASLDGFSCPLGAPPSLSVGTLRS
jgi:hypothetical protein